MSHLYCVKWALKAKKHETFTLLKDAKLNICFKIWLLSAGIITSCLNCTDGINNSSINLYSSERDLAAAWILKSEAPDRCDPQLFGHFLLEGNKLISTHTHTHTLCRCAETSYIHRKGSLTPSCWLYPACLETVSWVYGVAWIPRHPEEHGAFNQTPLNWSCEVFFTAVWRRVCYSCVARECFSPSVISGVGRGASSRPHHWHSRPCSTHNTEPLVAWQSTHISTTFISHSAPYFCLVSPLAPN